MDMETLGQPQSCAAGRCLNRGFDHEPHLVVSGPDGSRTHRTDLARISRLHRHAGPVAEVRPGIEPGLPPYHGGVLPKHLQTFRMIPDGVEPSSPACHAGVVAVGPRDRVVSDRGGSRTHRITRLSTWSLCLSLRTRSFKMAGPGIAPGSRSV